MPAPFDRLNIYFLVWVFFRSFFPVLLHVCTVLKNRPTWFCVCEHFGKVGRHTEPKLADSKSADKIACVNTALGPILFSIHTRGLPSVASFCASQVFADDNCLYTASSDLDEAMQNLSHDILAVSTFLEEKGVDRNKSKTQLIIFHSPTTPANATLTLPDTPSIHSTSTVKNLGIILDEHLSFAHQVQHLRNKVASKLASFRRARSSLTSKEVRYSYGEKLKIVKKSSNFAQL